MSGARRYPLEPLERLRRRLVDEARGGLARAAREREAARRRADEGRRSLETAVERRRLAERDACGGSAAEVEARGRWVGRLRREEAALGSELARLEEEASRGATLEEHRRELLTEAERQLRTVERHRELWEGDLRRRVSRAQEAELEDQAGPGARASPVRGTRGS